MRWKQARFLLTYWVPVFLYMGVIFYFSSKTGEEVSFVTIPDYFSHGLEYMGLSYLLFRALHNTAPDLPTGKIAAWAVAISIFYGITDEIHQYFVPGRTSAISDLLADAVGAVSAQVLRLYLFKVKR
ncbi:VanZ family protein [Calderihabitans maritimus]|uniref:Phosphotransbutyrylase n=1 Tax=Calderihabitans maritimus TaxID=1246530 RepID=A0A1Z5HUC1_9FIRM|nr:VanZ family protein [Calderihabitans maritimus]GAW93133.1 phosphotransbutyrylase [Calderihabitans maritimus]